MNLHDYLAAQQLEQKDFAESIGVSHSYVSFLALGKRKPSVDIAKRIEKATKGKVLAAVLLGLVEEKKPKVKYAPVPKALRGAARRDAKRVLQALADTAGVPPVVRGKAARK